MTCLFGYEVDNKNHDLLALNHKFLDEISHVDNALIVGADAGDNFYVVICSEHTPYVYYWDRTHLHAYDDKLHYDIAEQDECGHLYLVAMDFITFLNRVIELLNEQDANLPYLK
ncbi:SMI1/KNR4 family protein [Paenibacillus sp. 28ISP30-2]|nr:SMI1/KNR4 family protein [Paenibacillus sp. 28ISP30-2]